MMRPDPGTGAIRVTLMMRAMLESLGASRRQRSSSSLLRCRD